MHATPDARTNNNRTPTKKHAPGTWEAVLVEPWTNALLNEIVKAHQGPFQDERHAVDQFSRYSLKTALLCAAHTLVSANPTDAAVFRARLLQHEWRVAPSFPAFAATISGALRQVCPAYFRRIAASEAEEGKRVRPPCAGRPSLAQPVIRTVADAVAQHLIPLGQAARVPPNERAEYERAGSALFTDFFYRCDIASGALTDDRLAPATRLAVVPLIAFRALRLMQWVAHLRAEAETVKPAAESIGAALWGFFAAFREDVRYMLHRNLRLVDDYIERSGGYAQPTE
jgi:hypothetical protein